MGFIYVDRDLFEHRLWLEDPFSRAQAWVDLIQLAAWQPRSVRIRGICVHLNRGDVGWSVKGLADRWQWSRGKATRFLEELQADGRISIRVNNVRTVLSIVNYDKYQKTTPPEDRTPERHQNDQKTDTRMTPDKPLETSEKQGDTVAANVGGGHQSDKVLSEKRTSDGHQNDTRMTQTKERKEIQEGKETKEQSGECQNPTESDLIGRWNATPGVNQIRGLMLSSVRRDRFLFNLQRPGWWEDFQEALEKFPLQCADRPDGWKPGIDWILDVENLTRVLEGQFDWSPREGHAASSRESAWEQKKRELLKERD